MTWFIFDKITVNCIYLYFIQIFLNFNVKYAENASNSFFLYTFLFCYDIMLEACKNKEKIVNPFLQEDIMSKTEIIQIGITTLGSVALLLYGMHILGAGLEKISGGKMEKILEKLTNNIIKAVLLGA